MPLLRNDNELLSKYFFKYSATFVKRYYIIGPKDTSRIPTFDTATQISISSQGGSSLAADRRSVSNMRSNLKDSNSLKRDPTHSTQALFLLAEVVLLFFHWIVECSYNNSQKKGALKTGWMRLKFMF